MTDRLSGDAVDLMERDHHSIQAHFEAYRTLVLGHGSPAARKALADQICTEVIIHMRLENEMFYPLARQMSAGCLGGVDADPAHVREQIAQVLGTQPDQAGFDDGVLALAGTIGRQVQQERDHLFPAVRRSGVDLSQLAAKVRERRLELQTVSDALRESAMLPAYA